MTLQPLDRDLWVIDHALAMGGLSLGTRTTVLRLPDGSMALISPGPLDDAGAAAVTALGPVRALVAPNTMHHLWLADARRRFPDARLYAPPALAKKRPELPIDVALPASPAPDVLVPIAVAGMPRLDETAFVHRPPPTLVLT